MELSIQQNAYVDIISDEMTICYGEAVDFTGLVVAGNYNQILWITINGCGMFSDETTLNTTYMPSPMDYIIFEQTGVCTRIVVSVSPINPCVFAKSDEVYVCYQAQPEVITGPDTTITEGNSFNINGASEMVILSKHLRQLHLIFRGLNLLQPPSRSLPGGTLCRFYQPGMLKFRSYLPGKPKKC